MVAARRKQAAKVVRIIRLGDPEAGLGQVDLCASGLAVGVEAGRFAMLEAVGRPDCILKRPFSYFGTEGPDQISFLIKEMGAGSRGLLQARPGDAIEVLGPFGNTFPHLASGAVWGVAGGVGAAPFGLLADRCARVLLGTRRQAEAGFAAALQARGVVVDLATDDGSAGFAGSVLALLEKALQKAAQPPQALFACGPTGMLAATAALARAHTLPCYASLEERMGCGFGVCRGCAHRDVSGGWRCICVDGPVYDAAQIFAAPASA